MRPLRAVGVALAILALTVPTRLAAQEHPSQEHPKEHPTKTPAGVHAISKTDLEKAIQEQIAEKTKAEGGKFHVHDPQLNKEWALTLVRVHTDKLTQLDENTYFACTDFRADDATLVDVDFYMKDAGGKLKLEDTAIHKVNGKPRFTYEKKGNFWERVKPAS